MMKVWCMVGLYLRKEVVGGVILLGLYIYRIFFKEIRNCLLIV